MSGPKANFSQGLALLGVIGLIAFIAFGLWGSGWWNQLRSSAETGQTPGEVQGEVFGAMPKPTQPSLRQPVLELVSPPSNLRRMLIKRIPTIDPGARMPHPSWGPCTNCHLIRGGPPPGSQPATPVAKVWEQVSRYHKVGPPIMPNSPRPHPPSGRCIKCHDILVYVQTK
ncbi:MAG: magnetochrome domain-containing protein [Magnetococcales bacterium]|nr:magnetochrome domain-containing protein [Magnetococcales bacterium]